MLATVIIKKSFDDGNTFRKEYAAGDFEEFFKDEGAYLDKLADITAERGESGDSFEITYTVSLCK